MKIIHYIPSIDQSSGGIGSYMQLLAEELGKQVELHIVTHRSSKELPITNATIHYLCHFTQFFSLRNQVKQLLNSIKPDIVHVNCCWYPECALFQKWASRLGYKTVYTPHGMMEPWILQRHYWTKKLPALYLYQKEALKSADIIHATAESEKQNIIKLGYKNSFSVIPNGINVNDIIIKDNWTKSKKILFLSRVHVKKGIEVLLKALFLLKTQLEGYKVLIAGEGEKQYINSLKNIVCNLGLESIVDFVGGVYGERKWNLYRESDVFVLPTFSENFGIVVAEALASGTPVITTKGTPWNELEQEGCGWWKETTEGDLAEAINKYLSLSDSEIEQMGRKGRLLVERKYSSQKVSKQFVNMYSSLL